LFIVPTPTIVTSLRPTPDALTTVLGRGEMLRLQGRLLPLFRLGELFGVKAPIAEATEALAVVVEDNHQQAALLVDELLGQQQIVIKSLGDLLQGAVGIAGGAVMGNGRVGLIVDIAGLLRLASTTGEPGAASLADVA
jgi:two-component system chemotaxis sensor kinase CheA